MRIHHQPATVASLLILLATTTALAENRDFDQLAKFDSVDASAGVYVSITKGNQQSVKAQVNDISGFDHLGLYVENGKLYVTTDYSFFDFILDGGVLGAVFRNSPPIKVYVTIPELTRVDASSGAEVDVKDINGENLRAGASSGADINLHDISYEAVSLSASSGADIEASGTCISIRGNASSGADIEANGLECKDARANASSGGDLSLYASQSLDANASSGGDINIVGNPTKIDINTSSGGDVNIRR